MMCSVQTMILLLVFLFICRLCCAENNVDTCDFICGCESDLAVKFNHANISGERRGLFDPFPKNRTVRTSYENAKLRLTEHPPFEIVFVFVNIGISATFQHLINWNNIRLPYQAFVLILSSIAGIISKLHPTFDAYTLIATINPMLIMLLFLPSIVIDTVYSVDIYVMQKCVGQILLLGLIGFFIRSILVGAIIVLIVEQHWFTDLSFFIFGGMCGITQPQEALRVLKTVGDFKHITALLEAESLISLSLGIFVYNVSIFASGHCSGSSIALHTFNASITSILLGLMVGWVIHYLLKFISAEVTVFTYVVISGAYLLYYVTQVIVCFSGVISLMAYLWVLHRMKSALAPDDEKFFQNVISCFAFISNTMIFSMAGIVVTESLLLDFKLYRNIEFIAAFLTYCVTYLIRSLVLFSLLPLMTRIGYTISWRNMVLIIISGIRGSFALCVALASTKDVDVQTFTSRSLLCVSVLVFLSIIINPLMLSCAIQEFNLDKVAEAKVKNMTAILKDIIKGRSRALAFLKNDRGYSEANWGVVENFTIIKHPYPWAEGDNVIDSFDRKKSSIICPQCKTEERHYGTDADLIIEANLRILQMKKINFRRQYHTKLLSIQELRLLEAVIDHASDTRSKVLILHSIKDLWAENWFLSKFRKTLCSIAFIVKEKYIQPPLNRCRLKVYKIVQTPLYTVVVYLLNLLSVVPVLYDFDDYELSQDKVFIVKIGYYLFYVFFCILFVCDFILKILAMGFRQYFKFKWYWLEFVLLICSIVDCGADLVATSCLLFGKCSSYYFEVYDWLKFSRALYLLRILRLIQMNMSKIIVCVDNYMLLDKVSGYNVAQCVVRTLDDIIKYTQYMSENERPSFELEYRETAQRFEILKDLAVIQRDYPLVPITVKTKHAIQEILNTMQVHVDALKYKGIIDDMEIKKLTQIFEEKNRELREIIMVPSPLPGAVVKGISWLNEDNMTYEYLLNNAELLSFTAGDTIISAGDKPHGLYVFMTGSATSHYVYSITADFNQRLYGMLPNCDFLMSLNFDVYQQHKDIILPGFVIGEIGLLTDRPYNYNITCDTSVTVLHIAKEHMNKACKLNNDLEYKMWKAIAIKLASLKINLQFKKFLADTLKFHLQRGYFFILKDCVSLELNEIPEYFFLLEGALEDKANDTKYIAPTSIPDTAQSLTSLDSSNNEELLKGLGLPEQFFTDRKKVDIKALMVVPSDESMKYSVKSDDSGNYWIMEDQIDLFCDLHRTRESRRKESLIFGTFILTEFEEPEDTVRHKSTIERLFHSISSRRQSSAKGSNTDNQPDVNHS